MTSQIPEKIENKYSDVDFGKLKLFGISTGDETVTGKHTPYAFENQPSPPANRKTSTALWRGYIARYRIEPDGTCTLVSYTYPTSVSVSRGQTDIVNERLQGDFWLIMKLNFYAPRTYIPFRDGVIVANRSHWIAKS